MHCWLNLQGISKKYRVVNRRPAEASPLISPYPARLAALRRTGLSENRRPPEASCGWSLFPRELQRFGVWGLV